MSKGKRFWDVDGNGHVEEYGLDEVEFLDSGRPYVEHGFGGIRILFEDEVEAFQEALRRNGNKERQVIEKYETDIRILRKISAQVWDRLIQLGAT